MNSIRSEWHALKEKWFHGEMVDPVFEGIVRDFCAFDESMHGIQSKVKEFMKGVDQLAAGMTVLSDGVSAGLNVAVRSEADHQIASDSCKLKEATNQIARADAPHSAIAKLRRDMTFNILNPVQAHITNNRNLKVSLDIRRRRHVEFMSAKKQFEALKSAGVSATSTKYTQAQAHFETASTTFSEVDRHVFEWLYILEEYRGDILDSTLQTLKYLQYEFFATSAHAISQSLPSRMEFRPMVEMTPDHLEVQVEMELQESEEGVIEAPEGAVVDFSLRLIEKKAKEDPDDQAAPAVSVDPLSLSSLLSQGFEEGPARRALRLHNNDTQAAMDWLIDGGTEEATSAKKAKALEDGVRMPTTVKRVQKLKAMRRKRQEATSRREERDSDPRERTSSDGRERAGSSGAGAGSPSSRRPQSGWDDNSSGRADTPSDKQSPSPAKKQEPVMDLLEVASEAPQAPLAAVATASAGGHDLLGFDSDEPAVPTDFSKPLAMAPLPAMDLLYDGGARCEMQPLASSVAAGMARQRSPMAADSDMPEGFSPELLLQVQALAANSQVSPQQLLLAAAAQAQEAQRQAGMSQVATPIAPLMPQMPSSVGPGSSPGGGLASLDPFEGMSNIPESSPTPQPAGYPAAPGSAGASAGTAAAVTEDDFSSLVGLLAPK